MLLTSRWSVLLIFLKTWRWSVLCSYLEVVEVVASVQVNAFGFLVDGHDSKADVQGAMKFPSLDLNHNNLCFKELIPYLWHLHQAVKIISISKHCCHHCFVRHSSVGSCRFEHLQLTSSCVFEYLRIPFSNKKYLCEEKKTKNDQSQELERCRGPCCGRCITFSILTLCQPLSGYFLLFIK